MLTCTQGTVEDLRFLVDEVLLAIADPCRPFVSAVRMPSFVVLRSCFQAHRLGMYVLIDLTLNHVGALAYAFAGHETASAPFATHDGEMAIVRPNDAVVDFMDFASNNTFDPSCRYEDILVVQNHGVAG